MSPICFILLLLIIIMIPTLVYTIFFLLPCVSRSQQRDRSAELYPTKSNEKIVTSNMELVTAIAKFNKEEGDESSKGRGDVCPVCLTGFYDGEELRKLNYCKHLFHSSCIDKWLHTHSNCPVCRAFVGFRPKVFVRERQDDLWQGLPDSAALV